MYTGILLHCRCEKTIRKTGSLTFISKTLLSSAIYLIYLISFTGPSFNGNSTNTLNAKASDGVDQHITLAKYTEGNPISEFSDNINSARCTCDAQTSYPTHFKYLIMVIE